MFRSYFKALYKRTMEEDYSLALKEIADSLINGGCCLECWAQEGGSRAIIKSCV